MRAVVYLVEKFTGHTDENGVEIYYTVAARLTRASAEEDFAGEIRNGARVRKIIAIK
jgi:hypothetical protein